MATKVLVPRLGEGVDEVTVTKWLKQVGDSVNELEPLLEVESDKVTVEVPAPASGVVLKIEMQKGQVCKGWRVAGGDWGGGGKCCEECQSVEVSKSRSRKSKVS